jgi:hypothetical protein
MLEGLKKQMPFKWRVQSASKWGAQCVAYIDSRDVQDLFDEVLGAAGWQVRFEEHKGNLFACIGVHIAGEWVWKSDCGTESNIEKQKGEASDAFKRAAVMWGVGRFLYELPIVKLPVKEENGKFVPYSETKGRFIKSGDEISTWCNALIKK